MRFILFPFFLLWSLICFLFELMGRLISGIVGFVLILLGVILTITIVGAFIGIPLFIIGTLLLVRAFF